MDGSRDLYSSDWQPQTTLVRGGLHRSPHQETSEALYLTSGFVYDTAEEAEAAFKGDHKRYIYGRYGSPTVTAFEERLRLLEGAEVCKGTASGMAAVHAALICQLQAGDKVVASSALFGSCHYIINELLPRFGVATHLVDGTDYDQWEAAIRSDVTVTFLESPSNPTLEIIDIARVAELTHAAGGKLGVDNALASPVVKKRSPSVPTSLSIPRQSISMGKAAVSVEQFWGRPKSSKKNYRISCDTQDRHLAPSTLGFY